MKQYLSQITRWFAAVAVAIALVQSIILAANAEIIKPGDTFEGPLVPQFEISTVGCNLPEVGEYSFAISGRIITIPNFVPCGIPRAIDSFYPYPLNDVGEDTVEIENMGTVFLEVNPIPD